MVRRGLLVAKNTLVGEILHVVAIRYRVNGVGRLRTYLRSLDNVNNVELKKTPMALLTNIEPTVLANFSEQRIQLEIKITVLDETFLISRLVVFVKPVSEGYPIV